MKYLVRSIKYFFWFTLIFILIMAVLTFAGIVGTTPEAMFRDGYKSLWQIAALFAAVAAFYPKFGFTSKEALVGGEYPEIRDGIIQTMESRGYRLETEHGKDMSFRLRSKFSALFKMCEDRITLTRTAGGFSVEGITKEVVRIVGALEYRFRPKD